MGSNYFCNLGWFREAIKARDLKRARTHAARMREEGGPLGLHDALELLLLMADADDPDFQRARARWLALFLREKEDASEAAIAAAALTGLEAERTRARAELILRDLLCWVGDPRQTHQQHAERQAESASAERGRSGPSSSS